MSQDVDIDLEARDGPDGRRYRCHVRVARNHHGRKVTFSLVRKVAVQDDRPVDEELTLFQRSFVAGQRAEEVFDLPALARENYTYEGEHIHIQLLVRVVVDDGYFWDTTVDKGIQAELFATPRASSEAKSIVDPEDHFDLGKNLMALPADSRMHLVVVGCVAASVVLGTIVFAWRSLLEGEIGVVFFSIFVLIFVGVGSWAYIQSQLGGYMSMRLVYAPPAGGVTRDTEVGVGELFDGTSHVPLHGIQLRVVACNMEMGQYLRGSGTDTRTVSFSEPVRGVVLYSRRVAYIPEGARIAPYFTDRFSFAPLFEALYPPQMLDSTHGIDVHWEIQLIHDDFKDQELVGSAHIFRWEDFLEEPGAAPAAKEGKDLAEAGGVELG